MREILRFEHVGVRLAAARELLCDLELALAPGATAVIAGARGAGKTLIAELAAGLRAPERGRVHLFGRDAARLTTAERPPLRRRIGYAPAAPLRLPGIGAADDVAVPLRLAGVGAREARADAADLLRLLGSGDAGSSPTPEARRRIGIARAVIARPALVVLDEPFGGGGSPLDARVAALVLRLAREGTAFLITTGDAQAADLLPGTILLRLAGGRLAGVDMGVAPPMGSTHA